TTQDIALTDFSHRRKAEAFSSLVRIGEDVWIGCTRTFVQGSVRGPCGRAWAVLHAKVGYRSGRSAGRVARQVPVGRPGPTVVHVSRDAAVEAHHAGDRPIANKRIDKTGRPRTPAPPVS